MRLAPALLLATALAACAPEKAPPMSSGHSAPLSASERKDLRLRLASCWKISKSDMNKGHGNVVINTFFSPKAKVVKTEIADSDAARYKRDARFRRMADAAMASIKQCNFAGVLPPEKYDYWHEIELTFVPQSSMPAGW